MMAPNGDRPNPHRTNLNARAVPIEPSFYPRRFSLPRDGAPFLGNRPGLSLTNLLAGATLLLLCIAFIRSLSN